MEKLDLKKQLKHLYLPSAEKPEILEIPPMKFVMIDGSIEPGQKPETSPAFQEAFPALYGTAYTLKFLSKLRADNPVDYVVMPLEGLWWTDSGEIDFGGNNPWNWTLMVMQPDHITEDMFQDALRNLRKKKGGPALERLRFETFHEGLCVQIMHVGPYDQEPATIEKMRSFARENGYQVAGKHHEIYMGDPRRTKPEKLKTVLRLQLKKL